MRRSFVVLATQRSGTTALRAALQSCPEIEAYGEAYYPSLFPWGFYQYLADRIAEDPDCVLPKARERMYQGHLAMLAAKHPNQHVGMDVKYSDTAAAPGVLQALGRSGAVALHLCRKNLLKTHVSGLIMEARLAQKTISESEIHSSNVPPPTQVRIDPTELLSVLDRRQRAMAAIADKIHRNFETVIELTYEDLFVADGDQSLVRKAPSEAIEAALGLRWDGRFACQLKKQNSNRLEDLIENYRAVADALTGTPFETLLEAAEPAG